MNQLTKGDSRQHNRLLALWWGDNGRKDRTGATLPNVYTVVFCMRGFLGRAYLPGGGGGGLISSTK